MKSRPCFAFGGSPPSRSLEDDGGVGLRVGSSGPVATLGIGRSPSQGAWESVLGCLLEDWEGDRLATGFAKLVGSESGSAIAS